jgi:hypothetical protein
MVSHVSNASDRVADSVLLNATTPSASAGSSNSFAEQLASALENYLGQSGSGSQFDISIQPSQSQESGSGQYVVTITAPSGVAANGSAPAVATTGASPEGGAAAGTTVPLFQGPPLSSSMQELAGDWSVLTPQQTAFELANGGQGGGNATAAVPGTSLTFGELNQAQQIAYQYAENYGTGGVSMQDFLTQNAGPQAAWNVSYDQVQQNQTIQGAVDSAFHVSPSGVPMPIQAPDEYGTPPALSGNPDNLPNPALIPYLPQDQQAAAWAALAAEGSYGGSAAAAAVGYTAT